MPASPASQPPQRPGRFLAGASGAAAAGSRIRPAPPQQGPQQPQDQQQQSGQPGFAISLTVPVVNVDVVVTDNDGNYLNGLKKENFRITEDGAPQTITNFGTTDAPITVVLLLEFSQMGYGWFLYNAVNWADAFLQQLKPIDWVALESFNMRPNVEVDFTHNPSEVRQGLVSLLLPPFHESNLFDALVDVTDRLAGRQGQEGRSRPGLGHRYIQPAHLGQDASPS